MFCEYRVKANVAPINFVCMHVEGKATMALYMAAKKMLLPTEENRDFLNKISEREKYRLVQDSRVKITNQSCVAAERKQSDFGMFLNTLKCVSKCLKTKRTLTKKLMCCTDSQSA